LFGEEGAVAAVGGLDEGDVGVGAMRARLSGVMRMKGSSRAWRMRVGTAMRLEDAGGGGRK
jgi:hypothetical protein